MTYTLEISVIGQSQPRSVVLRKGGFRSVGAACNYYEKSEYSGSHSYQVIDATGFVVAAN